ncbi:hypothetical protein ADK99_07955 [Streptomyces sp. MMG1064]|nr:hypothetical protein ADK99_07955 [Streptomyces sp. MMG1064]
MLVTLIPLRDVVGISVLWSLLYGICTGKLASCFVLRQRTLPPQMLGRVLAATGMTPSMSIPVASGLGGVDRLRSVAGHLQTDGVQMSNLNIDPGTHAL